MNLRLGMTLLGMKKNEKYLHIIYFHSRTLQCYHEDSRRLGIMEFSIGNTNVRKKQPATY